MAMMRKEILVDQQAASSSGTNNRQVVTDLERLNKAILMILTQTISAGPVRDQGMVGLQNQEGKPYSDRDLPLKKRTSVRAMVDGNGGNQEGAPVAEGNPPPSAQQRYRRDRAAKGSEHQDL
ncbi:hypothetical protein Gohar_012993 [Gossypium harknessii]|uniref:Uncharacterized protein n=1 Tax=Gossypium harknessii TaxID=34285 RepID=A0A7J9GYP4_9ROSI|nr:hypothetical protein [Gossypium harknessii]